MGCRRTLSPGKGSHNSGPICGKSGRIVVKCLSPLLNESSTIRAANKGSAASGKSGTDPANSYIFRTKEVFIVRFY